MEWLITAFIAIVAVALADDLESNLWYSKNRNQADEYWMTSAFCILALGIYSLLVM